MDDRSILEQANSFVSSLTSLNSNLSLELDELFIVAKHWFDDIPRELVTESILIRKYTCFSHYYRWTEQYTEVFRCVIEISDFKPSDSDSLYCGWIYRDAARAANFLGLVNESLDYGYKSIALIERSQNKLELGKCYNLIGVCLNPIELNEASLGFYKKAYRIAVEINDDTLKIVCLNNMGYNKILAKDYKQAERILLKGKEMLELVNNRPDLRIQINNNLATVAIFNNNFAEAHALIAGAKQYDAINKITSDAISILQVESNIFLKENKPQDAIDTLKSALALATEKNVKRYAFKIEQCLANILNEEKRFEEAYGHLLNSLSLQEQFVRDLAHSQLQVIQYENEVRESRSILERRLQQTIYIISRIGELRDVYTAGHQKRVRDLAVSIAKELGLSQSAIMNLSYGALIHDIGKIYIASDILNKPGKITNLEYQILQTHSEQGYNIVKEVDFPDAIPVMIYQHHERLDGSGYPQGLSGDQIIIESRILAVADVVEAMSSYRPYRPALGIDEALKEIMTHKGKKYDNTVVDICIQLFKEKNFKFLD